MNRLPSRRPAAGFTLIELVITVAIIGVLALGALPLAELNAQRGKERELRQALRDIRHAIDEYKRAFDEGRIARTPGESGYPPSLELLTDGVPSARDPQKSKIYFLRRLPRDPLEADHEGPAHRTWGLRSYASSPEEPQPGKDVFDVYSKSSRVGINGVPYREW
jgi:general secretion pathway protein G